MNFKKYNSLLRPIRCLLTKIVSWLEVDLEALINYSHIHEMRSNRFLTFIRRPMFSNEFSLVSDLESNDSKNCAIIIQGPIVHDNNFTAETVKIYRRLYPDTMVVVSTWADEDVEDLKQIEDDCVRIILIKKPSEPGYHNINLQTKSTLVALREVKKEGKTHVAKTRSDHRIYAPNVLSFCRSLQKEFEVTPGYQQKERIIALGMFTRKYIPFYISDIFMFGSVDDMISYWDKSPDNRNVSPEVSSKGTVASFIKFSNCRSYTEEYYKKLICKEKKNFSNWEFLVNFFVIIDNNMLDLYWYQKAPKIDKKQKAYHEKDIKVTRNRLSDRFFDTRDKYYNNRPFAECFTFRDWLILYSRRNKLPLPKYNVSDYADVSIHEIIDNV